MDETPHVGRFVGPPAGREKLRIYHFAGAALKIRQASLLIGDDFPAFYP